MARGGFFAICQHENICIARNCARASQNVKYMLCAKTHVSGGALSTVPAARLAQRAALSA